MKTGLTKRQKTTVIYFDEYSDLIEVQTHNTDLKNRITSYAAKYPDQCQQTDDDEQGGLTFEIDRRRFAVRLTAPSGVSVSNNKKGTITVKWNKNNAASGYQVRCKTGSDVKTVTVKGKSELSKVIQKLTKNKTYTVNVRCYKTVSKVNYYSGWSAAKKVKITK